MDNWQPIETAPYNVPIFVAGGTLYNEVNEETETLTTPVKVVKREPRYFDDHAFLVCDTVYYDVWVENPTHWVALPELPKTTT